MTQDDDYEILVEVWKITEWKDGCVYKTESTGERWVPMSKRGHTVNGEIYGSLSTNRSRELMAQGIMTIRRKK